MKAAVCNEYGKPLAIENVWMEEPKRGEVKIRIAAAAICHSDIHSIQGEHGKAKLPALFGHEVAGYVEEVGEGVTYVRPGDPVICCLVRAGCGQCYYCITGRPNFCENWKHEFQRLGPYCNQRGEQLTLMGGLYAGFVEQTIVPEDGLVKIPGDMPMDRAALLACGVISGFGAVVNGAQVKPFSSVVVTGSGGVGLNAIQGAAFVGAHPIIAIDVLESKLQAARAFGATHTIHAAAEPDVIAAVRELTHGRGADYVFVTVAGVKPKRQAFLMLSRIGMAVFIGHGIHEYMSDWDAAELVGGRTMTGCAMGATRTRLDLPRLIELYQAGRLKLDELITGRYRLEQINEAIAEAERGAALRNVIVF
jgi:S-(hydroxymethyl)glutathione dehydrogenase/alcohol dehydrogenase